ncbi:MAG: hypothetical protein LC753_04710 [Acidobacteria bacterium]|nr:hypothetical protein [Acidobacteriota bacterium]MCA1649601.1 hypothetical protein [Acidobacteriota bacterium]
MTAAGALSRAAALVCAAGGLRATAVSTVGVLIALHVARRGLSAAQIGLVIGAGMAANAAATVVIGLRADRWGRRRSLISLGVITGLGSVAIGLVASLPVLVGILSQRW